MKNSVFFKQAELMLRLIPHVAKKEFFALKGGTAINFFLRNMPRLSVDIDLTYLPVEPREKTFNNIGAALSRIANSIRKVANQHYHVREGITHGDTKLTKLFVAIYSWPQLFVGPLPTIILSHGLLSGVFEDSQSERAPEIVTVAKDLTIGAATGGPVGAASAFIKKRI